MFGFGNKVPSVNTGTLKKALDEKSDLTLLDVRTAEEYVRGHIKGSINLPLNEIAYNIQKFIPDKNKTIYVYCLSGSRSNQAAGTLSKLGYKNVFNVESGLLAWRASHFPLET